MSFSSSSFESRLSEYIAYALLKRGLVVGFFCGKYPNSSMKSDFIFSDTPVALAG